MKNLVINKRGKNMQKKLKLCKKCQKKRDKEKDEKLLIMMQ